MMKTMACVTSAKSHNNNWSAVHASSICIDFLRVWPTSKRETSAHHFLIHQVFLGTSFTLSRRWKGRLRKFSDSEHGEPSLIGPKGPEPTRVSAHSGTVTIRSCRVLLEIRVRKWPGSILDAVYLKSISVAPIASVAPTAAAAAAPATTKETEYYHRAVSFVHTIHFWVVIGAKKWEVSHLHRTELHVSSCRFCKRKSSQSSQTSRWPHDAISPNYSLVHALPQ